MLDNDPLWYRDAIIYELHVKAFFDSTNDGIGDFRGLAQKLDYLQDLGVNTLWLLPFYPSPLRDDGYDIADYRNVHPAYGTMGDFRHLVREAHRRGLRVITELVINHTSDQHPWFQAARRAPPGSNKRDYYVWSDTDQKFPETRIIFTDTETSNWAWDKVAKAYYWHRFFSHQPDLNYNNPRVVKAVLRVMRYWFDLGVDGMRLDAIPYLCVAEGTNNENLPETHAVLKYLRAELDKSYTNRVFLAEANQWPEDVREYFGNGDECHMAYHFPLMPRIYMAVAQEDRHPVVEIMRQTPEIPDTCQWAIFLRNHDELTLEMVTDRERDYMYQTYATDPRARLNLGIRRRLAPLMENNRAKIELMNSLLMSMPGSPIIYYGDEIGMGDNVFLGDRNGVRTPMQWSPDRNGGFSRADPASLYLPPIMDPVYGYEARNVEAQARSPASLLNWTKRLIAVRKAHRAFGRGSIAFLQPGNRKVLAYLRELDGETILCVANLARTSQPVELALAAYKGRVPVELTGRTSFPPVGEQPYLLTLPGYGFFWFRLAADAPVPHWHLEVAPPPELPVLVLLEGWRTLFSSKVAAEQDVRTLMARRTGLQLEREVLPRYLSAQRWCTVAREGIESIDLIEEGEWKTEEGSWVLAMARVTSREGRAQTYSLPLALKWDAAAEEAEKTPWAIAKIRQKAQFGVLLDALGDESFCRAVVSAMGRSLPWPYAQGTLEFSATRAFPRIAAGDLAPLRYVSGEDRYTLAVLGERLALRAYRRLTQGTNPELEMARFLTEASPFANIVPLAGALEYRRQDDAKVTLALLHTYVESQSNGWYYTLNYLERYFESCQAQVPELGQAADGEVHAAYVAWITIVGTRTAELHAALSKRTGDPAFDPEPISGTDLASWTEGMRGAAVTTFNLLEQQRSILSGKVLGDAEHLLGMRLAVLDRLQLGAALDGRKIRCHGDYSLACMLLANNDVVIFNFEGNPSLPLSERRSKRCGLLDVAGMVYSIAAVAEAALAQGGNGRPEAADLLRPFARDWARQAQQAFVAAYLAAAVEASSCTADLVAARAAIMVLALSRAMEELGRALVNPAQAPDMALRCVLDLAQEDSVVREAV